MANQPNEPIAIGSIANELTITGVLMGKQQDNITYTSKKTNQQVEACRDVLVLQTSFGIVICRSFNNDQRAVDLAKTLEVGKTYVFAVTQYQIDNGLKSASIRLS